MRRLRFPIVMPYRRSSDYLVWIPATREVLLPLGAPGYVEDDPTRTGGMREFFWAFEAENGLRFQVSWDEGAGGALVQADPPDAQQTISALRALGVDAAFEINTVPEGLPLRRYHAFGAVWLFTGQGAAQPTAVFSRKQLADEWLARTKYSGTLVAYPLDESRYDMERRLGRYPLPLAGSAAASR
ncbi:hypothetical protein JQX13_41870 [Archangium violaceum]|uniref:DUF7710 domain-containing protein n=1 Tax=Archangium violaceum TaxID=83451 RepID=UPI00193B5442|nr:hypothetical protein [Archangium violaceum]QRK06571.1 hypothetical protein JQX13_41870 [Archangium violaceum]